jgi:NADH:ubiquinone oxidoreductase subunit 4 (chain M)
MRSGAVAEFRCHRDWTPVRGTSCVDSGYQRRISGGRRWPEPAARIAHLPDHSIRIACATRSRSKPRVLRDHARHAVCALRTFTAQNFVLWFLFYEMSLIPGFLLIKIWGGENRDRAATKFFLYTFLGSVAMLLSFLGIYFAKGTFDFALWRVLERAGCSRETRLGRLCWNFCWPCGEGAAVSVSHLAAGRLSNCAYRRVDGAHWRAIENGRLRFRAPVASVVP